MQDQPNPQIRPLAWGGLMLGVIAFAAAFWLLRETMEIVMPLVTALLLAVAVWPMVGGISTRMPRGLKWLGPTVGMVLVLALVGLFLAALGFAISEVYKLVGDVGPAIESWLSSFGLSMPALTGSGSTDASMMDTARRALGLTASTITGIVLILFLMLLMLTEVETWHRKFIAISSRNTDRELREMGRSIGEKFRTYFNTRVVLGGITALLYVGWLAVWGVDYLLLWGLLAVLLNFIPTVGSIVAGLLPVAYALITRDPTTAAIIAGGLLLIEQIMGNLVDPLVLGKRIAVSPLVILIALGFWTIVWGIPGAILAVPLTVLIILVLAQFENLKPVALLLTDRSSFAELEDFRQPEE